MKSRIVERAFLAAIVLSTVWALLPSRGGFFVTDDNVFIATAQLLNAPWRAFVEHHFYEPHYFRPAGLLAWSISYQLFNTDYSGHAALNIGLHLVNVLLIWWVCGQFGSAGVAKWIATSCFAIAPWSATTVLWLSNRFDLLATTAALLALSLCISVPSKSQSSRTGSDILRYVALVLIVIVACFSKEWAFSFFAGLALSLFFAKRVFSPFVKHANSYALAIFLGIVVAAIWRTYVIDPASADAAKVLGTPRNIVTGFLTIVASLYKLVKAFDAVAAAAVTVVGIALLQIARVTALTEDPLISRARFSFVVRLTAAVFVLFCLLLPQTLTFHVYAPLVDKDVFGAATTARFYYAPFAWVCLMLGWALRTRRVVTIFARVVTALTAVGIALLSVNLHATSTRYAAWTQAEVAIYARAGARIASLVVETRVQPCVVVLLGTQVRTPWFRMFSDASVKLLAASNTDVWSCHVVTESTPWLFITRADSPLPDIGLVGSNLDGHRRDSVWGQVRYQYRLMPKDILALRNARFFDWKNGDFVEVTDAVRTGTREVKSHGWGF
jgi:hypothetical protein